MVVVLVLVIAGLLGAGLKWHVATELTAVITAVYAILVYYQLKEMERQREQQRADKEEERRGEIDRRPILRLGPFEPKPPFLQHAPEIATDTGSSVGSGIYAHIPLTNDGKTLARKCQSLLTAWGKPGHENVWESQKNWVPLGLRWILDEPNIYAAGKPTEERDLVPKRPYLFNLGCISTQHPDKFRLLTVVEPTAQSSRFDSGTYCFEVTAFSENADPVVKYYKLQWAGGFTSNIPASEASHRIIIEELDRPPWEP